MITEKKRRGRPPKRLKPGIKMGPATEKPASSKALGLLDRYRKQASDLEDALAQAREVGASARDLAQLNGALARVLAHIGKITGEGEISEASLLKSPAMSQVISAVLEALAQHPQAAVAVRDAIGKLAGVSADGASDNSA